MIETPSTERKPAANTNSQISGRTSAETKRLRCWMKRSPSRQTMPMKQRIQPPAVILRPSCRFPFGDAPERVVEAGGADRGDDVACRTLVQDFAAVEDDGVIVGLDLVDQMRRPEHGQSARLHQTAHVGDDVGTAPDVEADGRLVA